MKNKLHPDTPVIVEWYTYRFIPHQRHAVVTTYAQAVAWSKHTTRTMTCHTLDTELYRELTKNEGR